MSSRLVVLAVCVSACLPPVAHWPYRGDFVCTRNDTSERRQVIAQDGAGRKLAVRAVRPGDRKCYRWPFIDYDGRVGLASPTDTAWGEWFRPWRGVRGGEPDSARREDR